MGQYVRCKITGFEGTVTSLTAYVHDAAKASVQPQGDGKSIPDALDIDCIQLEVITDSGGRSLEDYQQAIPFGAKVKCSITDYEGIVFGVCYFLNGCVRYGVQPKHDHKREKLDRGTWFAENLLIAVPKQNIKVTQTKTGGPIMRSKKD
jgi:hypothetical protein